MTTYPRHHRPGARLLGDPTFVGTLDRSIRAARVPGAGAGLPWLRSRSRSPRRRPHAHRRGDRRRDPRGVSFAGSKRPRSAAYPGRLSEPVWVWGSSTESSAETARMGSRSRSNLISRVKTRGHAPYWGQELESVPPRQRLPVSGSSKASGRSPAGTLHGHRGASHLRQACRLGGVPQHPSVNVPVTECHAPHTPSR